MGTEDRSVSISVCDPLEKFRAEPRAWSSQRGASSHLGALSAEFGAAERKWLLAPCLHVSCCTLEYSGSMPCVWALKTGASQSLLERTLIPGYHSSTKELSFHIPVEFSIF